MPTKLDPLPKSDDEYWEHADINKLILTDSPKCEHYFVRTKGVEVECHKCRVGYFLSPEFLVKNGHIYQENNLVV